jgi:hypothetical protein
VAVEVDAELCEVADDVCMAGHPLESFGPVDCPDLLSPAVDGESCAIGSWVCTQTAAFGPYEARVEGRLNADCAPTGAAGEWSCRCSSEDNESAPFTWAAGSVATACIEAFEHCTTLTTSSEPLAYGAVRFLFQ